MRMLVERLVFHEVDRSRWVDLERLFDSPGGPKYCWCSVWRPMPSKARRTGSQAKKAALESRVRAGVPIGILGYIDGEPVAWCSIAPRATYRDLGGVNNPVDEQGSVWSIVCFFVPRRFRRQGVTKRLIEAAVGYARTQGATVVEAYPVDSDSPSYRFMGFIPSFTSSGFYEVGTVGSRRYVMQLVL